MNSLCTDAGTLAQWPTAERLRALKRIIPRAQVQAVLRRTGHARRRYLRLPAWFMVWFVIALGLFCRDSYRQVFKWLQPFRRKGTPERSTFCEARQRLGVAPPAPGGSAGSRTPSHAPDSSGLLSRAAADGP